MIFYFNYYITLKGFCYCFSRHFFAPYVPELNGLSSFPRQIFHSSWYKEPEPFAGQAVLVVGAGPSGMDLIIDLSSHAQVVYLSSRKGLLKTKVPDNVKQLPGITELKEDGRVCFENGEERSVDCIVLATGYLYSYPFLTEDSGIKTEQGRRVTYLYKHTFNVSHPSMAVVGVNSGLFHSQLSIFRFSGSWQYGVVTRHFLQNRK